MRVCRTCVLVFGALTGCVSHVDLTVPPPSAPLQTRVDAYSQLRGLSYHETTVTTYGSMGSSTTHSTDYMQLADGTRVYYPEDILTVVPEDSPPAKAAEASRSKRETSHYLTLGTILSVAAGATLAIVPIATAQHGNIDGTPILIGLGVALFGGLGFGIAARIVGGSAQDEAATAYETYDLGLMQRLNLCGQDHGLRDCGK